MSKLFALEDINENTTDTELEAAAEVGEVADVQTEIQEDVSDTNEAVAAIDEGIGAADQLEEVEEVVANAAEEEGLDPVAAEAIRIAVEAICARVGANPKVMYPLYATENFQSASSRRANTVIALEGIREFLKDIWNKIKTAVLNLWNRVKEFWNKHFSKLGRIKKALESMREKISESSGKLKSKAYIEEAPSGLSDAFAGGDISVTVISEFIKQHKNLNLNSDKASMIITNYNDKTNAALNEINSSKEILTDFNFGEKDKNSKEISYLRTGKLIGGLTIEVKFDVEDDGNVTLDITREHVDKKDRGGVVLAEKNEVKGLLNETLNLINENIKYKSRQEKVQESFNKLSITIEKAISKVKNENEQKILRNGMKAAYKINSKLPIIDTELSNLNVKLAKAVISYAALCLKNYK